MADLADMPTTTAVAPTNLARSAVLRRLAEHGGWISRFYLAASLQCSEQRVDDEMAELVAAGSALYNARGREYRLAGSALARSAMKRLLEGPLNHVLLARPHKSEPTMLMGLATRARDYTGSDVLVMLDMDMPYDARKPGDVDAMCEVIANWGRSVDKLAQARQEPSIERVGA